MAILLNQKIVARKRLSICHLALDHASHTRLTTEILTITQYHKCPILPHTMYNKVNSEGLIMQPVVILDGLAWSANNCLTITIKDCN